VPVRAFFGVFFKMFKSYFFKNTALLFSVIITLGGCSHALDKSYQMVRVETPGAVGARCYLEAEGIRYPVNTPGEVSVSRTKNDLNIDCLAPGNRRKTVVVPSRVSDTAYLNAANGIGIIWDATSGAMHEFPDIIQVSFLDVPVKDQRLPLHDAQELKRSSPRFLEEFKAGEPRLNSDRFRTVAPIKRRQRVSQKTSFESINALFDAQLEAADSSLSPGMDLNALGAVVVDDVGGPDTDFSRFNKDVSVFPVQ